jgi:hypothetical protein
MVIAVSDSSQCRGWLVSVFDPLRTLAQVERSARNGSEFPARLKLLQSVVG